MDDNFRRSAVRLRLRGSRRRWRNAEPRIEPLEIRTLLSTATITTLGVSSTSPTYGQSEVLTATVSANPASGATPSGGTVAFMDGSTALGTSALNDGQATLATSALAAGLHVVTAVYSGDAAFGGSSSAVTPGALIQTVAGNGIGDGGLAVNAVLNQPEAVAVDASGNLFIADRVDNVIREVNHATGVITTVAGNGFPGSSGNGGAAISAELWAPSSIAIDAAGNLYIADTLNNMVREVNHATGVITTIAGNGAQADNGDGGPATSAGLWAPSSLALDSAGNLYILDGQGQVREVNHTTGVISTIVGVGTINDTFAGPPPPGNSYDPDAYLPSAIAVDATGNLFAAYVGIGALSGYGLIQEVNRATGVVSTIVGADPSAGAGWPATRSGLSAPSALAFDASGNLFVADQNSNEIHEVNLATGEMTTIAGWGFSGYSGDGGPATSAALNMPSGIAFDAAGNVLIADSWNNVIREVNHASGVITTVAGGGVGDGRPATTAELRGPSAVAVDSAGNLFIADSGDGTIREVNHATGVITTIAGLGYSASAHPVAGDPATSVVLASPSGLALDGSGNLFIADTGCNTVLEVHLATGAVTTVAGNGNMGWSGDGGQATSAELAKPSGVAIDAAGNLFIADTGNSVIREVNHATGVITTVAGNQTNGFSGDGGPAISAELDNPSSVVVDASGNLYIADTYNNVIREVNHATGIITTIAGDGKYGYSGDGGPATSAKLAEPTGLALDAAGNLFTAVGNTIREVNLATGIITTVAGGSGQGYSGDGGLATSADLNNPTGVAVDSAGNLFIADTGNNRIREVSAATAGAPVVSVAPAPLTISANSLSTTAGLPFPALTASYSGFVNGDGPANLTSPPAIVTTATSVSPPGVYQITASGASSPNYTISYAPGSLTIDPAIPPSAPTPPPAPPQPAPPPPLVTLTSVVDVENKKHQVTEILVTFSGPLTAASADQIAAYHLATPGTKHSFTAKNAGTIRLGSAVYNGANVVALYPKKPFTLARPVHLLIHAEGTMALLDARGRSINGNSAGTPGGDPVEILTKSTPLLAASPPVPSRGIRSKPTPPLHTAAWWAAEVVAHNHAHRFEVELAMAAAHHDHTRRGGR